MYIQTLEFVKERLYLIGFSLDVIKVKITKKNYEKLHLKTLYEEQIVTQNAT